MSLSLLLFRFSWRGWQLIPGTIGVARKDELPRIGREGRIAVVCANMAVVEVGGDAVCDSLRGHVHSFEKSSEYAAAAPI
mmetsp:Transcript_18739/g.75311  ORF Transcript_18739/g.75311 Transcript_18739/m.75311 type:complete len:80 (-) Transcript_18739:3665-3904(-)